MEIRRDLCDLASLFIPCFSIFLIASLVGRVSLPRFYPRLIPPFAYCARKSSLTLLERVLRTRFAIAVASRCHKFRGLRRIICGGAMAATGSAGRFLESVASLACPRDRSRGPGINLNYKFHRTMARTEGGPPAVNASGREGDCARWPSVERINLIYLPFIRPSVAPPDVGRRCHLTPERLGLCELFRRTVIYEWCELCRDT
jgi:hypothetical protein